MIKFIFNPDQKGWFKALGLHHAGVALITVAVGLLCLHFDMFVLGAFISAFGGWFYAGREWKEKELRRNGFEIMDFVSPFVVSLIYLGVYYF